MTPQHYPIEPGILYGGEYPGDRNPAIALARLEALVDLGIRTFVDLTTPNDGLAPYAGYLDGLGLESGFKLKYVSMPVPDMGVPSGRESTLSILEAIRKGIADSPAVYVHCWGGIGRTGTVAGCWLREAGASPDAALAQVQERYASHMAKVNRHPHSPQTDVQREFVRNWGAC